MAYTTIDDPEQYFQTVLYTGNSSSQSITFDGDSNLQPNFVWTKRRNGTGSHRLVDTVRGIGKAMYSNGNDAEASETNYASFDSDGFSFSGDTSVNENTHTYVSWAWKEDTTAGFDIVTYTGASGDQTFAHSLGVAPEWYLVKERGNANSWVVNHIGLANQTNAYLLLNTSDAAGTDSWFNSTAPSSSVVHANDGDSPTNRNGGTYVMYLWRSVKGFSKFGSYTGNGNANGTFIYTGFRPAWVMIKSTGLNSWEILDNKRNPTNVMGKSIFPDGVNPYDYTDRIDILSNGFKTRTNSSGVNGSGVSYIYMAFAESPFVNSNGVPTNAR